MLKRLSHEEELAFLKEVHGEGESAALFGVMREAFVLLQTRAQMLLGLATICLTITGFSGPGIAQSNGYSRVLIGLGLLFVLASVCVSLMGPLRLQWMYAWKAEDADQTILELLRRRDQRTRCYRIATLLLAAGLIFYLFSLLFYLLSSWG